MSLGTGGAEPEAHPWDRFLVGPENALAFDAVATLARGAVVAAGPLVVHGPTGVGKSHLLSGLVLEWTRRRPGDTVAHLAADDVVGLFEGRRGFGSPDLETWRAPLREASLFVLEDLQGLMRSPRAIVELEHRLDELASAGAAVVVSAREGPGRWRVQEAGSRRAARAGVALPPRLLSRLRGGLTVAIEPPGAELKRRYLLGLASAARLTLSVDAVEAMTAGAENFPALAGAVRRLALEVRLRPSLAARPIEAATVVLAAGETGRSRDDVEAEARQLIAAVAARFSVSVDALAGSSREASLVLPRHLAIWLIRERLGLDPGRIGRLFGGRDRKTVRHAIEATQARLAADPSLLGVAEEVEVARRRKSR